MARSNGPLGPPRAPSRRHSADDQYAPSNGQWQPPEYADAGPAYAPQPPPQSFHFPPPEPDPNYGYHQQHQQQHQPPPQQWPPPPGDPRALDLGNYMPQTGPQHYAPADPGHFQQAYSGQFAPPSQGYAEPDAGYADEFLDEEEDEPRRGRRWLFVVAALVGAVGLGGALAYTYKSVIAPSSGRVPLVKAGDPNVKVRPDAGPSKKVQARVDDIKAPASDAQDDKGADPGSGPRVVKTIPIGTGPAADAPPPAVPGITLDNIRPPQPPPAQAAPPGRVVIGTKPPPPPPPAADEQPPAAPVAKKQPPAQAAPPAVVTRPPPKTKEAAKEGPVAVATSGAGFVAVLSSQKSRVDALKAFADLREKYTDVLSTKAPDVQEVDLSARGLGTMYRLVVGPPGSRDAASGVCHQLKTAGYQGCWVTEY